MRKIRVSLLSVLVVAMLLCSLALAGCGGEAKNEGITFRVGSSAGIDTLNPLTSYMTSTYDLFGMMYSTLVCFDENQETVGDLAESWEVSEDELVWTFHLREGVKWHDGEAFTSADVKYTYELMMETGLGYMYESGLAGIVEIECPDDHTIVITTDAPKYNMLYVRVPILPQHYWEQIPEGELETHPNEECIGTGPFKFDSQGVGFVMLTKNADYYGTVPAIDNFVFVTYDNFDSMAQALMLGEIDAAMNLNVAQMDQLEADPNVTLISGVIPGFAQIGVNCFDDPASGGNPLLLIKEVRQAIEYATDKQLILDMVYGGQGSVATTLVSPGSDYHLELGADVRRDYDPAKAAALLEAAGYVDTDGDGIREVNGVPLEFEFITIADNTMEFKASQIIAAGCLEAGIQLNLVTMDSGALGDKLYEYDFDMFIWGWGAGEDPAGILSLLISDQVYGTNEPGYQNPAYDALYVQLQTEMNEEDRVEIAHQMQAILYEDAPYILLLYDNNLQAYRSDRWEGLVQIPSETGTYFMNNTFYNYVNVTPKQ